MICDSNRIIPLPKGYDEDLTMLYQVRYDLMVGSIKSRYTQTTPNDSFYIYHHYQFVPPNRHIAWYIWTKEGFPISVIIEKS